MITGGEVLNDWKDKCCHHLQKNWGGSVGARGNTFTSVPGKSGKHILTIAISKHVEGKKWSRTATVDLLWAHYFSASQIIFLLEMASSVNKERARDFFIMTLVRLSMLSAIVSLEPEMWPGQADSRWVKCWLHHWAQRVDSSPEWQPSASGIPWGSTLLSAFSSSMGIGTEYSHVIFGECSYTREQGCCSGGPQYGGRGRQKHQGVQRRQVQSHAPGVG